MIGSNKNRQFKDALFTAPMDWYQERVVGLPGTPHVRLTFEGVQSICSRAEGFGLKITWQKIREKKLRFGECELSWPSGSEGVEKGHGYFFMLANGEDGQACQYRCDFSFEGYPHLSKAVSFLVCWTAHVSMYTAIQAGDRKGDRECFACAAGTYSERFIIFACSDLPKEWASRREGTRLGASKTNALRHSEKQKKRPEVVAACLTKLKAGKSRQYTWDTVGDAYKVSPSTARKWTVEEHPEYKYKKRGTE